MSRSGTPRLIARRKSGQIGAGMRRAERGEEMRARRWFAAALAALAAAAPAVAADDSAARHPQTVVVGLSEYQFSPSRLRFRRGVAYRLRLVNRGTELHEFAAPDFFRAVKLETPGVLNRDRSEIEVPPGSRKDLLFVAEKPGIYELRCPDHDWAGMVGEITVK